MLAGPSAEVHKAFKLIQEAGPELGLELNVGKNELVTFFENTPDPFPKKGVEWCNGGSRPFLSKFRHARLSYWRCGILRKVC